MTMSCSHTVQHSPVSSHGETGDVRSAPSRTSAQQWWYRSKAAWSHGSSAWFHLQPTVGASFGQALRPVSGCTPALLPPASSSYPLTNAATSPPWSHPISSSWYVSTWHQRCLAVVLSSIGAPLRPQGTVKRKPPTQKRSRAAVCLSSDRDPQIHLTRARKDRTKRPEPSCRVGAHQVWGHRAKSFRTQSLYQVLDKI